MEQYELTKEALLSARTYMPLAEKEKVLTHAIECFDKLRISDGDEPMPPMWKENVGLRARYLTDALVRGYLGLDAEEEIDGLLTVDEYDKYAGSHIIMQIERYKRDAEKELRDRAYDLLSDYFRLDKAFCAEIKALLDVQNDQIIRQQQVNKKLLEQFPVFIEELKQLQAAKGDGENGS